MRIGHGYDVHRLVEDRKLILGGVEVPYEKGLLGHSDADVLLHAVMDAVLGAAALGDIGQHFPDTDPAYKGADSLALTREVASIIAEHGYKVGNIDATILCQRPKLAPHIPAMRQNIADAFGLPRGRCQRQGHHRGTSRLYRRGAGHCGPCGGADRVILWGCAAGQGPGMPRPRLCHVRPFAGNLRAGHARPLRLF